MGTSFCLPILLIIFFLSSASTSWGYAGKPNTVAQKKLFVFGDSYSDTGNWKKGTGSSWNPPYGSTFPGKPAGRFSDGRIITDFLATYLGIGSPLPYEQRNWPDATSRQKSGMSFAYGGTGVFDTDVSLPNMTTQIDIFQNVLEKERIYSKEDLKTSIALVTVGGNDYAHLFKNGSFGSFQELQKFAMLVVQQLASDVSRLHGLGVSKVAVAGMEPAGCLPSFTNLASSQNCVDLLNKYTEFHNTNLRNSLWKLNKQATSPPPFLYLDLYHAFFSAFNNSKGETGDENPLKPCCEGISSEYNCGSREGNEVKYKVCAHPEKAFFWDSVHPSQNGWNQVFLFLKNSLKSLL